MFNNYEEVADVIVKALSERRPLLRMSVLQDNPSQLLRVVLSLARWELFKTPTPRWTPDTMSEITEGDCTKALVQLVTHGTIDSKEFYTLPIKVQQILHYASSCKILKLNESQIVSITDVLSTSEIVELLDITGYSEGTICSKCGVSLEDSDDILCDTCIDALISTVEYRSTEFHLYGISVKDFNVQVLNWEVDVYNNKYTFTPLQYSTEEYQPKLPIQEYQDNVSVV